MQRLLGMLVAVLVLQGCGMTKVVTVPMRVGGEIISVVPVVGDAAEAAIDTTAAVIDVVPL